MAVRLLLTVGLAFTLGGCTAATPASTLTGTQTQGWTLPSHTLADPCQWWKGAWTAEGAFGRFPTGTGRAGFNLTHIPPPRGLALDDAALRQRWGNSTLLSIEFQVAPKPGYDFWTDVVLDREGHVHVYVGNHNDTEWTRGPLIRFLANVTTLSGAALRDAADAILAAPSTSGQIVLWDFPGEGTGGREAPNRSGNVSAALDVAKAWSRLLPAPAERVSGDIESSIAYVSGDLPAGRWTFRFGAEQREAVRFGPSAAKVNLNAADELRVWLPGNQTIAEQQARNETELLQAQAIARATVARPAALAALQDLGIAQAVPPDANIFRFCVNPFS